MGTNAPVKKVYDIPLERPKPLQLPPPDERRWIPWPAFEPIKQPDREPARR